MLSVYNLCKSKHRKLCDVLPNFTKTSRFLNLMEFQSKQILKDHGLATQEFCLVSKKTGFKDFENFYTQEYVVKAQVLAGGRGKGHFDNGFKGGVKLTKDREKVKEYTMEMLGHRLITKQTDKDGILVNTVMISEGVSISKETYVCLAMDRQCNGPVIMVSPAGGVNIELIAKESPHLIRKIPIDIYEGMTDEIAIEVCNFLRFKRELRSQVVDSLKKLWNLFVKVDALQIEINPFASTKNNEVTCIDAKLSFDDNAKYRQEEIYSMTDYSNINVLERDAEKYNLNYVRLDGNIACLVNGAGLAMATMDIIHISGGKPSNFLDIGGSVNEASVKKAFDLILSDKNVEVILVNVFGGIVNCEMIAQGIIHASKDIRVPLVVRLEGTNAEKGRKLLEQLGDNIESASDFEDAATKAVAYVKDD